MKEVLAIAIIICLAPAPNHSKLNEIAPVVTRSNFIAAFVPYYITLSQSVFSCLSISAKTNRLFFTLGGPDGPVFEQW